MLIASPVHAALDEVLPASSPEVSTRTLVGHALRVRERGGVREFAGRDGKVFAMVWRGHFAPNLLELLGPHVAAYRAAVHAHHGGHSHFSLRTPELALSSYSHARLVQGNAWLPLRMPEGVTIDALR